MRAANKRDIYLEIERYDKDVFEVIDNIKNFILTQDCPFLIIDISKMNLIDASKICILCSTFHFAKYYDGNVTWRVRDIETQHTIRYLKLKNVTTEITAPNDKTIEYFDKKYRSSIR